MTQPSFNFTEPPKSQTAEVLYELLHNKETTRRDFILRTGILNPTARIAELRHEYGLTIHCTDVKTRNKHNRAISYGSWSLPAEEVEKARVIYEQINQ